jgi:hypothetical protein
VKDIPVIAIGYDRPDALERLLNSLDGARYPTPVKLYISIDGGGKAEVVELADKFKWNHGRKEVIVHKKNLGLREHVLRCGDLSTNHDAVIVLEDDLVVSPHFYEFAFPAYEFYKNDPEVSGISLYAHAYNETSQFPFLPIDDGSDVFFMQYAPSWGQLWTKEGWKEFRDWYGEHHHEKIKGDPEIPANIQYWPESSWKKFYIKYLIRSGRYFVYPRVSFATMFNEGGTHIKLREHFLQVPLQIGSREYQFKRLNDSKAVYDVYGEMEPPVMKRLAPFLGHYDFAVDLYGMKPVSHVQSRYILTIRQVAEPILTFGREMKPHEMNVIRNIPGNDILLAATRNCPDPPYLRKLLKVHEKQELAYRYPMREYHFGKEKLITTEKKTERSISPGFFFRKVSTMARYAWGYFFGRR